MAGKSVHNKTFIYFHNKACQKGQINVTYVKCVILKHLLVVLSDNTAGQILDTSVRAR